MSQLIRFFPRIYKGHGQLVLVYSNRVEEFKLSKSFSKSDLDKAAGPNTEFYNEDIYGKGWNASHEIRVLEDNGFREVHVTDEENIHEDMEKFNKKYH